LTAAPLYLPAPTCPFLFRRAGRRRRCLSRLQRGPGGRDPSRHAAPQRRPARARAPEAPHRGDWRVWRPRRRRHRRCVQMTGLSSRRRCF